MKVKSTFLHSNDLYKTYKLEVIADKKTLKADNQAIMEFFEKDINLFDAFIANLCEKKISELNNGNWDYKTEIVHNENAVFVKFQIQQTDMADFF